MTRAAAYYRYSSDKQDADSIEAQRRACTTYAAQHGLIIAREYSDEAISGKGSKTAARAAYQRMLRDCDKELFSVILIHKYDRVARNIGEHVNLEKRLNDKNIRLVAVSQDFGVSNESKITKAIVWAMSEYYLDNLADEVRKGHRESALKALHNGGLAPFGYEVENQTFVVNALEAAYVRKMFDCAASRQGFKALVEEMNTIGLRGKRGKPIHYSQIYEILRNEKYTGVYLYSPVMEKKRSDQRRRPNAIRIENAFPAIISASQFEEVQSIMNARKQTGKKANYLCSGLVYCSCGAKMHALRSRKPGFERVYFHCPKKCGAGAIIMEDVDRAAVEYLAALLSPDNQLKIAAALRKYQHEEASYLQDFNKVLKAKIDAKQTQYDALMDNLAAGSLPPVVVNDLGQRMQKLKDEMDALRDVEPPKDFAVDQIKAWLESLKAAPDEKAIHLLIERIDTKSKTDFSITSTLKSVLGEIGSGGRI